jgi:uncharacterized SAM-binding protein YcdF (DUF218 family)
VTTGRDDDRVLLGTTDPGATRPLPGRTAGDDTVLLGTADPGATQVLPAVAHAPASAHIGVDRDPTPVGGVRIQRPPRRWRRRILLTLAALILLSVGYYGVTLWQVHSVGQSDQARPVDALVVLGAAQYDGTPSPQLQGRLDHALELWSEGLADTVVVTGGNQPGDRFTEAEAAADYLRARGVPTDRILLEDESHNTYDALRGVADLLDDGASVLIVTDPYHSLRSRMTASEVGLTAYVSPTDFESRSRELKEALGVSLGRIIGFRRLLGVTG